MPPILFISKTLPSIEENLALDEALLLFAEAENTSEILRIWEFPQPAIILGLSCSLARDIHLPICRKENIPIQRRSSGGGTVLVGQGCLLYSLILRMDRDPTLKGIRSSFQWIMNQMSLGLAAFGPIEIHGISDLTSAGKKFSGNAQQRKQKYLLHHGTILYQFDLSQIPRYLQEPPRQPEYRLARPHSEFIINLEIDRSKLIQSLQNLWHAEIESDSIPQSEMERLLETKYRTEDWVTSR